MTVIKGRYGFIRKTTGENQKDYIILGFQSVLKSQFLQRTLEKETLKITIYRSLAKPTEERHIKHGGCKTCLRFGPGGGKWSRFLSTLPCRFGWRGCFWRSHVQDRIQLRFSTTQTYGPGYVQPCDLEDSTHFRTALDKKFCPGWRAEFGKIPTFILFLIMNWCQCDVAFPTTCIFQLFSRIHPSLRTSFPIRFLLILHH